MRLYRDERVMGVRKDMNYVKNFMARLRKRSNFENLKNYYDLWGVRGMEQ